MKYFGKISCLLMLAAVLLCGRAENVRAWDKTVTADDGSSYQVIVRDETYSSEEAVPEVDIRWKSASGSYGTYLDAESDYTVSYGSMINAGTYKISVALAGEYSGKADLGEAEFTIKPAKITENSLILDDEFGLYPYTGKAITPAAAIEMELDVFDRENSDDSSRNYYNKTVTLRQGTDYTVTYSNNINPGQAVMRIQAKGNYTGTITKTFVIEDTKAGAHALTLASGVTRQIYGFEDFLWYKFTAPGTGYYEFEGTGFAEANKTSYMIGIFDSSVPNRIEDIYEDGGKLFEGNPEWTGFDGRLIGAAKLVKGKTYYIVIEHGLGAGSAQKFTMTARAHKHSYHPMLYVNDKVIYSCPFCGLESTMKSEIVLNKTTFQYNKKVQKPTVTSVRLAESGNDQPVSLKAGRDYKVSYSGGCKAIGTYQVTVTYLGDFSKLKTVTIPFTITPKKTSITKLKAGKKSFTVTWKKVKGVSGYLVEYSKYKNDPKANTVYVKAGKKSVKVKGLKSKKKYYVTVSPYKNVKGNPVYAPASKAKKVKTK